MAEQIITQACQQRKEADQRYNKSEKGKERLKHYKASDKGKIVALRANVKYAQTAKGKARRKRKDIKYYQKSPNKMIARIRVYQAVKKGQLPPVNSLKCACGEPAKHYHHHKGYEHEYQLDVIPVCEKCHKIDP